MPKPVMHREGQAAPGLGRDVVLEIWQRRKWLALIVGSAVFSGAIGLAAALPDLYRASSTVIVERQQVSEAFVRPSVTAELETRIQTIEQQVMSRARLTEVIGRLNLYPELRGLVPIDALVERMRREVQLGLKSAPDSSGRTAMIAFSLSYSGRDPRIVADVANTVASLYVKENTQSRARQASRTAEFLKSQLTEVKRELDQREAAVGRFKSEHAGELLQQTEVNLAALDRLNTELRLNGEYQIRAMERRGQYEREMANDEAPAKPADPASASPAVQLRMLRQRLVELRRRFSDQYPDVLRVQAEIASLEQAEPSLAPANGDGGSHLGASEPVTPQAAGTARLAGIDEELASLRSAEAFLRKTIAGYELRVENAPRLQEALGQLTREYDSVNERYESLLKRYQDAELAESLEQGQNLELFRILDPAIPPLRPVAPNRMWLLVLGLVASLASGMAAIVVVERLDTAFHDMEDLRTVTDIPILATIRRIPTPAAARRQRRRAALVTAAALVGLAVIGAGAYRVADNNESLVRMLARPAN